MVAVRYQMSFTSGGLLHRESIRLAELYLELGDWEAVKETALAGNLLQVRAQSTARRQIREILSRLKLLSSEELRCLVQGTYQEQASLLWVVICRRYQFIQDFTLEVLREHFANLKTHLNPDDYEAFYNKKAEWHPELDAISNSTRLKLKQVIFRMLREANLLTADYSIHPVLLSPSLVAIIQRSNAESLRYLPGVAATKTGVRA
ncbi:DUF1819 family protein [Porticoccus hydrocarbonoclasticus]|uniref:DUF1819 family protein n=1 Tax=Porticoccus hydrocarbonoclasticus TaxID=1073414 RepID=UPI0006924306|nr:DUF1819 family protein [Porticoccus hydrocarbonoclasticus]